MNVLEVQDLKTHFTLSRGWLPGQRKKLLRAVDGISFSIKRGEILGLVGESGCGKSTVGRTLTRLENASAGSALLSGAEILKMSRARFAPLRRHIQMIFQDPFASLNPRLTIEQSLAEPLRIHKLASSRAQCREIIAEIFPKVGLDPQAMTRFPHEFSGGQRQRIGIARVMILSPKVIIADEPVSALDVSVQAQVLNLLKRIQRDSGVAMLFVSHDLGVIRHVSDMIAVMYLGRIVETGTKAEIFSRPAHPYTRLLLASIPRVDPNIRRAHIEGFGEPADAADPPAGCAFHPRCPHASALCRSQRPKLMPHQGRHAAACHHAGQFDEESTA